MKYLTKLEITEQTSYDYVVTWMN